MNIQFSASATGERNLGLGGGPNLMARNIVSAEDTYTDGLYWMTPWDLTQFGDAGAAVISANGGKRYAWLWSSDHYDPAVGWHRGGGIHLAFGSDIAIPPKVGREIIAHIFSIGISAYNQLETPWLLLVPEDEEYPWRMYGHGVNTSANRQNTVVYRSADFETWELLGVSHEAGASGGHHAGYQVVFRRGENDYWSFGGNADTVGGRAIWNSTDAVTFTRDAVLRDWNYKIGNRQFGLSGPYFDIGEQRYVICKEDATHSSLQEGVFVSLVPVDENLQLPADVSNVVRLSSRFGGPSFSGYPGPKYMQGVESAIEDGIAHIFPKRGFFSDTGIVWGANYEDGGGLDNEFCDYYRYILDETTARTSAPAGVRASAAGGLVTLRWYNALPQNTYRVYRDTDPALGTKTLIGNVTGIQATDTPPSPGTYYYEVMTLNAGVEEQSRVVSPYVSTRTSLANEHVTRVLAAGGDIGTIDLDYVEWAEDVLNDLGIKDDISYWVMPEFGHIKDGSNVLSKVFCLGSTIHPRGGDLTFTTSSTTYGATAWNGLPAWTSSSGTAYGIFGSGRLNNIRRARNSGLTLIASVYRSHSNPITPFGWGEQTASYFLQVGSGSPGAVAMSFQSTADTHGTTIANSADHIIGGVITSSLIRASVEGVLSAGTARPDTVPATDRLNGQRGSGAAFLLGYGSEAFKMNAAESSVTRSYSFGNGRAQMACRHLIAIRRALNDTQMATLNALLRAGP